MRAARLRAYLLAYAPKLSELIADEQRQVQSAQSQITVKRRSETIGIRELIIGSRLHRASRRRRMAGISAGAEGRWRRC